MALITLLRHAPLPVEKQGRFIGHSNFDIDLNLTDVNKYISLKNRAYDEIYSSDLLRCTHTLDLIEIKYLIDSRLREVKFKEEFEGKNFSEVEKLESFNIKYLDNVETWHKFICKESYEDFESRIKSFLSNLPKNKDILICSHGGTIKMIYSLLKNENYNDSTLKVQYIKPIDVYI